jgi:hypothetical protein
MAQMTTVSVPAATWTQITNADATAITFQNVGEGDLYVKGTVGANAPSTTDGALQYASRQGERNATLSELFPGVSGVNRVYVWSQRAGSVSVNHA